MADVKAVADKVAVLRLGRNNGVFEVDDHLAGRDHLRHHRRHGQRRDPPCGAQQRGGVRSEHEKTSDTSRGTDAVDDTPTAAAPARCPAVDPRLLVREQGLAGYLGEFKRRMRGRRARLAAGRRRPDRHLRRSSRPELGNFLTAENLTNIAVDDGRPPA